MTTCPRFERVIVTTTQVDPAFDFVGSSPYSADRYGTGIVLPPVSDTPDGHRLLCNLGGVKLGPNSRCIIQSVRQLLTVGYPQTMDGGQTMIVEVPVRTANWHFVDGAVSWHLRRVNPKHLQFLQNRFPDNPTSFPPYAQDAYGLTSSILSRHLPPSYAPLNGGLPYGTDVAGLGTFRDMRYPFDLGSANMALGIEVLGPCDLKFFASVKQTDPETRPAPPAILPSLDGLVDEDKFVLTHPEARYWRIGCELVLDICNPTDPEGD